MSLGKTIKKFFVWAAQKMSHRCVLILGCQRSGTTLLYMMLTSHPSIRGKNEDEASYWLPKIGPVLWNLLRAKYTCYKLPTKTSIPEFILKRFPGTTLLWIIRHPYAVISSMRSLVMNAAGENWLKISAPDEMERLACLFPEIRRLDTKAVDEVTLGAYVWKYKMMALERFRQIGLRPFVLKYEDLVLHPRETLEPVLTGLSLVWKDQVVFYERHHAKKVYCGNNFGNKPLDKTKVNPSLCLNQEEMEKIEAVCGDLIKKYYGN
jgi:protein-tyrosine sulfotransferase